MYRKRYNSHSGREIEIEQIGISSPIAIQYMESKYFCGKQTHVDCAHDWDAETTYIRTVIERLSTNDPFVMMSHNAVPCETIMDEKDRLIQQLTRELKLTKEHSESFWQRKLASALGHTTLRREVLSTHRFVTDLSNQNILVEIKHHKDFRTAVGQVCDYNYYKRQKGDPTWFVYILLFGDIPKRWSATLWHDRALFCLQNGILLRWLLP